MIPVHLIPKPETGEAQMPEDKFCFLVGSNGVFKKVANDFYTAVVPVDGPAHLADIKEEARLNVPKLPVKLLRQTEAFFAAVYARQQSEAVILLLLNPAKSEWRVEVPSQSVRGLHVSYDLSALPPPPAGFSRFGTIHSHASIKAFHSSTDDTDEASFDGLHITVGNVDQPVRSYAARWMLAGREFKAELGNVIEAEPAVAFDPSWLDKVQSVPEALGLFEPRELLPPGMATRPGIDRELSEFETAEEYEQRLLAMREEIEERLLEVGVAHGLE